jgi:hypothetical protein
MMATPGLIEQVNKMQKEAPTRKRYASLASAANDASTFRLTDWPEHARGIPNGFLRSALFAAIARGKRCYIEREQLAALDGLQIYYTGQRLDQGDLDVFATVLHATRFSSLGCQCRLRSYGLLKLLGKTDTGKNRRTLQQRLTRLRANAIEIRQGSYVYIGGLIDEAQKHETTQEWLITLNPKLQVLFAHDQFTRVQWAIRHSLDGKPLAQWLHGFYSSHAAPFPYRVETLQKLCGSDAQLRRYRQTLAEALAVVAAACEEGGEEFEYKLRGDLVHVHRTASEAQRRHLSKKSKKSAMHRQAKSS